MYQKRIEEAKAILKSYSTKGVQAMLDAAAEVVGNPIVVIDLSYNLLYHTKKRVDDDPLTNELLDSGKFSHETVAFFGSEKFIDAYANSSTVAFMKSDKLKYDRATGILYNSDGMQIGSFCVVACVKPFDEGDFKIMELVAKFIADELKKSKYYCGLSKIYKQTVISRLIEGKRLPEAQQEIELDRLYQGLKQNIYVAVIDIMRYDPTLTHLVYIRDVLKKIKGDFHYYIYLNNIVAIMSTDEPLLGIKKELKELNQFFIKNNIFAGISDSFQNLNELRSYFKEALHALNFGMEMNYGKNIFMFADFRLEAFIKDKSDQIVKLCHPVVFYMCKYDIQNNTNYRDILYIYLLAGRSSERAASVAKMELAEFNKKLAEIEDIFEIDFTNMNTVFAIFCCMKLQEYFPEKFLNPDS